MDLMNLTARWLTDSALGAAVVLTLGAIALAAVRRPARRQRIGEWMLAGCLLVAVLAALPGMPRWSLGILPAPPHGVAASGELHGLEAYGGAPGGGGAAVRPTGAAGEAISAPPSRPWAAVAAVREHGMGIVVGVYGVLLAVAAARLAAGWVLLRRLVREGREPEGDLARLWADIIGGMPRRPRLLITKRAGRPMTFGLFSPVVLVPERLCETPFREELRLILLHELVHVRRRDARTWLVAAAAGMLFFYQPLYWWLRRQLRLAQEFIADAWAAKAAASPEAYAANLLRMVREDIRPAPAVAAEAFGRPSEFYQRMQRILGGKGGAEPDCTRGWTAGVGLIIAALAIGSATLTLQARRPDEKNKPGYLPSTEAVQTASILQRGVVYLRGHQEAHGGWLEEVGPAPTALVVRALVQAGTPADDPAVRKAIAFVEKFRQEDGGYYREAEPAYTTAIVLSMFAALPGEAGAARVQAGRAFLERQKAIAAPVRPLGGWYAGAGAEAKGGRAAWLDADERAADAVLESYGALTYAGLKSIVYAGLTRDDGRVRAAVRWVQGNWRLDCNPGLGTAEGQYYFYHAMARALRASGQKQIVDGRGGAHDWRAELSAKLASLQRADGSWVNQGSGRWLEDRPELVTAYCVLALQETLRE